MAKGIYNNQGRKSGGYKRPKLNIYAHSDGKNRPNLTIQCFEGRHEDCNHDNFPLVNTIGKCECSCHQFYVSSPTTECQHLNFDAQVNVIRLEDSGRFMAEVKVECRDCHTPFQFLGMEMGLSFTKPMVEVMSAEARLPIKPMDKDLVERYKEVEKEANKPKGGSNSSQS